MSMSEQECKEAVEKEILLLSTISKNIEILNSNIQKLLLALTGETGDSTKSQGN
ncbi:hypothetical protein CPIN18021_0311 [Campylobacter pinnipediorum subsp. caledonicus]|uniref:Uncharacterized protein n=2 Tax=Campylobacter TaxID=194 RepID=A0A1S6U5W0_9BACT|nr:hypothetical protein [Campylobacter pinnipediorum]AQW85527.1 hypothetical protein CPIN18020_0283 [Campylobacter pinnipediorum subsp. caledonicus]AQW87158.1 hypothetical protein CPIN18021_0311 [Campylobacter pinnipediorum subsp. caledonicus]